MFRVEWIQSAVNETASGWTAADTDLRKAITEAVRRLDQELERHPLEIGESRERDNRVCFSAPVAMTYRVDQRLRIVTVLHVRIYRPRNK